MGRRRKGETDTSIKNRLMEKIGEFFFARARPSFSMDDVARSSQVSKKTLYRFFPNKEDMILTVAGLFIRRIRSFVEGRLEEIDRKGPDAFVPAIMEILGRLGSIIMSMAPAFLLQMESQAPLVLEKIFALRHELIVDVFSRILSKGQELGKIRRDLDTALASHVYSGMIDMITSTRGPGPSYAPFDVYITVVKIVFQGVLDPGVDMKIDAKTLPLKSTGNPWEVLKRS